MPSSDKDYRTDIDAAASTRRWVDNKLGINSNRGPANTPANDAYAALTRDAWIRYVSTWVPYEDKLIEFATDPTQAATAMSEASAFVDQSFRQQQGATQRRLSGLGLRLDADEQSAVDRSYGLAKSLADVSAQNMARDQTIARQQSVLGNPAPALPNLG